MDKLVQARVLIIVQNLPVPFDRRVWMECQTLRAAGYTVSVICPKGPGDPSYELLDGIHLYKYRPAPAAEGVLGYGTEFVWCWLLTAAKSVRVLREQGFDVMQACNPPDTYWALALPYKVLGKRFLYDQHDLCPEVYASRFGDRARPVLTRGLRWLERATYRVADHVISTNASYKRMAMTRGARRAEDVTIVRSGPDTSTMRPGPAVPSLKNGHKHLACYLGVMGPQDGVDRLIHSWDFLVHDLGRDDCQLVLMGFGDCLEPLKQLTRDLDLEDHVSFTGRADAEMISEHLSTADLGVCPDPHSPLNDVSTTNKTMEYMAFGLPVVTFDLPETAVSAGDAAVYVSGDAPSAMAEAVAVLLDDVARREELGERALRRAVDVLDWRLQAVAYLAAYDRVLSRPLNKVVVMPDVESPGHFRTFAERRSVPRESAAQVQLGG